MSGANHLTRWFLAGSLTLFFSLPGAALAGDTQCPSQITPTAAPPEYFTCVSPYYAKGSTKVIAQSEAGPSAEALFVYMRCTPPGSTPPWAN